MTNDRPLFRQLSLIPALTMFVLMAGSVVAVPSAGADRHPTRRAGSPRNWQHRALIGRR